MVFIGMLSLYQNIDHDHVKIAKFFASNIFAYFIEKVDTTRVSMLRLSIEQKEWLYEQ